MKVLWVGVMLLMAVVTVQAYDIPLTWDCTGGCATATGFNLYQRQSTDCSVETVFDRLPLQIPGTARQVTVTGLQVGLTYCWYVTAYNTGGESGASNTYVFQVPVQKPEAPSNLHRMDNTKVVGPNGKVDSVPFWLNNDGTMTVQPKR